MDYYSSVICLYYIYALGVLFSHQFASRFSNSQIMMQFKSTHIVILFNFDVMITFAFYCMIKF